MKEYGDLLDENRTDIENTMIFGQDASRKPGTKDKKENHDDPMWSSESPALIDWLYENE